MLKKGAFIFSVFSLLFISSTSMALQLGADIFGLDFRFNNPGARANALGGAFIGLADDATAGYANPAGLTILFEPEVSFEFKGGLYTNRVFRGVDYHDYDDEEYSTSFISLVYPVKKASISIFRHHLVNIDSRYVWRGSENAYEYVDLGMDVVTTNVAFGLKVSDNFSVGIATGLATLKYRMINNHFDFSKSTQQLEPDLIDIINDDDNAETYTLSSLWNLLDNLSIGLVYRYGPEFKIMNHRNEDTNDNGFVDEELLTDNKLKIPDSYGLGIAYRLNSNLTMALDVDYIEYSDLLDDAKLYQNTDTDAEADGQEEGQASLSASDFKMKDTMEIHVGVEYVFPVGKVMLAARTGYLYRPDHRIYYEGLDSSFRSVLKKQNEDEHIYALGFGCVIDNSQFDISGNFSDQVNEGTFSVVYRF